MPGGDTTIQERLREAIAKKHGSVRAYARVRAGGETASEKDVEKKRRELNKWLQPDGSLPGDTNAEMLARELDQPDDYFKTPKQERRRRAEEIAALWARLEELAGQLEAVQKALRRRPPGEGPRRSA